jgi:hypothetical protein
MKKEENISPICPSAIEQQTNYNRFFADKSYKPKIRIIKGTNPTLMKPFQVIKSSPRIS